MYLFVIHAPETLLGRLVLGCPLVVTATNTPALAIDDSLGDPTRCSIVALGDGTIKYPLDRLVVLLQALIEQAKMTDGGRIGECPARLRWWCWRRMTSDGRFELVVRADRGKAVLLADDAVCLAHVGREELV